MSEQNFPACATHLCCLVCSHPAAHTGQVSPAHTRCVPGFSSVRRTQGWETWERVSVILPSEGPWAVAIYPQPKEEPQGLFFSSSSGVTCLHRGRGPARQAGVLLGSAGGFSGNL